MRLLTWNIHKGIGGVDRRYAPERIAAVVRHYDPDVLLLQEVDDGVPRSRRDRQHLLLSEMLELPHVAYGPNVWLKRGRYGNATLSRFPITTERNIDVTFPMKKGRGALLTDVSVPVNGHHYKVHILNVHLGLASVERRWQVRRLLEGKPLRTLDRRSRVVVAGDTNDWTGALSNGRLAQEGFLCVTGYAHRALRTFPAWGPMGGLDKVFLRGPIASTQTLRPRLRLARQASDHLPIVVELSLGTT